MTLIHILYVVVQLYVHGNKLLQFFDVLEKVIGHKSGDLSILADQLVIAGFSQVLGGDPVALIENDTVVDLILQSIHHQSVGKEFLYVLSDHLFCSMTFIGFHLFIDVSDRAVRVHT